MPQFCTVFYKESLFFSFCSCCTFLETPLLLSLPVLCELLAVIDSFDELHGCRELHPPVGLLSRQTVGIETADVLHGGQQARGVCLYENKDQNRNKIISPRHGVLVGQAEQVHDGGAHPQDTLHLVPGRFVGADGADLGLRRRPRRLAQVHLRYLKCLVVCSHYFG